MPNRTRQLVYIESVEIGKFDTLKDLIESTDKVNTEPKYVFFEWSGYEDLNVVFKRPETDKEMDWRIRTEEAEEAQELLEASERKAKKQEKEALEKVKTIEALKKKLAELESK